jgi:hypothetical protein
MLVVPTIRFENGGRGEVLNAIGSTLGDSKIELRLVDRIPPDASGKRRIFVSQLESGIHTPDA